ncbi:hypothetical protein OG819_55635 [Streptomyces sp. NBC_01549]|uniref:hypothetical protein n=1 Tax=Streptomyces sp. NBC_01549 TaxID=2975874 RepID=UPI00225C3478|nr:hypothetical protein [Streptomyces sp. NBC_01549]MCX4598388.1 hypothetical protein [Streptomyces sp. NBC_01549]
MPPLSVALVIAVPVVAVVLVACLSPNARQRADAYRVFERMCSMVERITRSLLR